MLLFHRQLAANLQKCDQMIYWKLILPIKNGKTPNASMQKDPETCGLLYANNIKLI